jgi:rhodanese-related sulfurtransferase
MPAINAIAADKLLRLIATPAGRAIIDIRTDAEFDDQRRLVPGSLRRPFTSLPDWAGEFSAKSVVVVSQDGRAAGHGAAAWLRQLGADAEVLDGGVQGWCAAGHPTVDAAAMPAGDGEGRTLWVTRARPKVDRIACPWLIRRFVDPHASFLYVAAGEVAGVAERMGATPFDIEGENVRWTHRGELCTFDVMIEGLGLGGFEPLDRLAAIVRGADTAHPELVPEAAGLLAISLGLSRMYADDIEQLDAGMLVYDALYRWCRDATGETHDWTSHTPIKSQVRA